MATEAKRAWKLQEFVAHGSNINCLSLGPSTGRVMVTGGEDRKVNMWAVGQPNVIMSLAGHTSPVECVQFNSGEDLVVAGSQSGTLKIWDLEAAKILRTLTGHKSSIRSLDFHPFGDFVASGSLDTNLKLWDIRRKGCIFTYKGHTDCVNHLRFSPDGRWIISGGEDGAAKLWDLTAGKIINDFKMHTGPVNCAEFHPKEFLLATGSSDRTVKYWDLETFELVSSTSPETHPIRCIGFHTDGLCLFSGAQDSLKVYGWEPIKCYESFPLGWGKLGDFTFYSNQLIGAGFSQTNVSVWVVNIVKLIIFTLFSKESQDPPVVGINPVLKGVPSTKTYVSPRMNFNTERPPTTSTKQKEAPQLKEEPNTDPEEKEGPDEKENADEVFQERSKLDRSPPLRKKHEPFVAPLDDTPGKHYNSILPPYQKLSETENNMPPLKKANHAAMLRSRTIPIHTKPVTKQEPFKQTKEPSLAPAPTANMVPSDRDKPAGLQMADFLPVSHEPNFKSPELQVSEAETLSSLSKSHASICAIMAARQRNLSLVARYWADGEVKTSVETAVNMNDQAILVDVLNVLCLKQTLWNLGICLLILPNLKELFHSKYESYVQAGASALKLILRNFAPVIKSNMAAPPVSVGVDLVREERYGLFQKCQACHSHLMAIRNIISSKTSISGKMGSLYRELSLAFAALD
ncbi:predicted protein [Nematostella vectensis]|uniref:Katanin p80 WD40 repeat-containing subunit B1 n=1 Tax=Nematostella vectensis TaxID=45351 RepID=A7SV12_NEMVE|nr:predicted protein [Nematostella vectensis]|eukprot:XP_001624557.1 predicted protein [Nematostella vectensis]